MADRAGGERVAQAPEFERFLAVVKAPALRAVALHWDSVRCPPALPAWRDIDAAALKPYLPILWSWKYDRETDRFTGRLAGEHINLLFGRSLRGRPMAEFFRGDAYSKIFARHKQVVTEPAFYHGGGLVFRHEGRGGHGERIILPLAEDGRNGDGILGATVYELATLAAAPLGDADVTDEIETFFPIPVA